MGNTQAKSAKKQNKLMRQKNEIKIKAKIK
jgi:hypothetical protein